MNATTDTLNTLRQDYRAARAAGDADRMASIAAEGKRVAALLKSREKVWDNDRSKKGKHKCGRCGGTGRFVTMVVNGKPKGPGGICFRCSGKGYHDQADRKRNEYYDTHRVVHI